MFCLVPTIRGFKGTLGCHLAIMIDESLNEIRPLTNHVSLRGALISAKDNRDNTLGHFVFYSRKIIKTRPKMVETDHHICLNISFKHKSLMCAYCCCVAKNLRIFSYSSSKYDFVTKISNAFHERAKCSIFYRVILNVFSAKFI